MKKYVSALLAAALAAALFAGMPLPSRAAAGAAAVVYKDADTDGVELDGDLSDWEDTDPLPLKTVTGSGPVTGWIKLKWSANRIYVAVKLNGESFGSEDQAKFLFNFDGVPAGDTAVTFAGAPGAGVHSFNGGWYTPGGLGSIWNPGDSSGAGTAVVGIQTIEADVSGGNTILELAFRPLDAHLEKMAEGNVLGFDFRYNNGDAPAQMLGWASDAAGWGSDLRKAGAITLAESEVDNQKITIGKGTPVIDGALGDWADADKLDLKVLAGTEPTSGWIKLKWDDEAVYVAGQIADAQKSSTAMDHFKFLINFDGVPTELTLLKDSPNAGAFALNNNAYFPYTGTGDKWKTPQPWNPTLLAPSYNDPSGTGNWVIGDGDKNGWTIEMPYKDGKYTFETRMPAANAALKAKLAQGGKIGFDFRFNNGDGSTAILGWSSAATNWGSDMRKLGEVMLGGAVEVQPLTPTAGAPKANQPDPSEITSTSVPLSWTPTSGAGSHQVNVFSVTGGNGVKTYHFVKSEISSTNTTATILLLEPNTEYAFQVVAYSAEGDLMAAYEMVSAATRLYDDEDEGGGGDADKTGDDEIDEDETGGGTDKKPNPETGGGSMALAGTVLLLSGAAFLTLRKKERA